MCCTIIDRFLSFMKKIHPKMNLIKLFFLIRRYSVWVKKFYLSLMFIKLRFFFLLLKTNKFLFILNLIGKNDV